MLRDRLYMQYRSSSKAKLARKKAAQKQAPAMPDISRNMFDILPSELGKNAKESGPSPSPSAFRNQSSELFSNKQLQEKPNFEDTHVTKAKYPFSREYKNLTNDKDSELNKKASPRESLNMSKHQKPKQKGNKAVSKSRDTVLNSSFDCDDLPDDISDIFDE